MATIKFTYGDVQDNAAYVGEENTISVDTEKKTLRVHDGVTPGGSVLATEDQLESFVTGDVEIVAGDGLTGGGSLDGEQVTVSLGTPSTITGSTTNESSANSHTHAISVNKIDVGLSNVDNTSDLNKPISNATQTALNAKVNTSDIGVTVAALVNGKVPLSQMDDSVLGQVEYKGTWNATTNVPTLPATPAEKGIYYVVSTGGTFQSISFAVGDWIISNGSVWQKVDNTDAVTSVAGRTGAVTLTKTDVGLSNVDNTSDLNKPISTATQTALNAKAPLASPVFTGNPEVPTQPTSDNSKKVANTEFVKAVVDAKDVGVVSVTASAPISVSGSSSEPTISITPATASSAGSMSAADKSKLDGIQAGAQANSVTSVAGKTGAVVLSASDVGGLGTAATSNVTVSATDTTSGRVLKNGDWGIPTDINMWTTGHANAGTDSTGTDLNTLTTAGWWRKLISPNSINKPSGGSGYWYLLILKFATNTNVTQIAFPYGTNTTNGNIQYRHQYDGVWSTWRTIYDTNNLSLTASSTDGTTGRVTKVGDFGLGASGDGVRVTGNIDDPDLLLNGFYSVLPPTTTGTFPTGWGTVGGTLIVETFRVGSGVRFVKQTLTGNGSLGNKIYFRLYNGNTSTWSAWLEMLHLGNQLNLGTTVESGRTALGLGTAAVGTLTTSTTDNTVGKVLKVGDFGIGSVVVVLSGADLNTLATTGFYTVTSPVNGPSTTTHNVIVVGNNMGGGRTLQIAQTVNTDTVWIRSQSSGVWSSWRALYHTGNQFALGATRESAVAALGLSSSSSTPADSNNTPSTLVLRDTNGDFSARNVNFVRVSLSIADPDICLTTLNGRIVAGFGAARGFNAGSLLISNAWADASKVPSNGIYSKGIITTDTSFRGSPVDTTTAPSYTWENDSSTGMYRISAGEIGFSSAGTLVGRINSQGFVGGGSQLVNLNAGNLSSGVIPNERLSGTYSGISVKTDQGNTVYGATSPGSSQTNGRMVFNLASFQHGATITGAIVFIAPSRPTALMHNLTIKGMLYNQNVLHCQLQGYSRSSAAWLDMRKVDLGSVGVQIRFGVTPDNKNCIILGDTTTVWSYPHIAITDALFSFSGVADSYCTGWSSAIVTDLSAYTFVTTTIPNSTISNNAATATRLQTGRTISISGAAVGTSVAFTGEGNLSIDTTTPRYSFTTDPTSTFRSSVFGGQTDMVKVLRTGTAGIANFDQYSPGLAWSTSDTHAYMCVRYQSPRVTVGAGSGTGLVWTRDLAFADHTHTIADVAGLQAALDSKADGISEDDAIILALIFG